MLELFFKRGLKVTLHCLLYIIQFHSSTSHIYVELRRYIGGIHMEIAVERVLQKRNSKSSKDISCNSGRKAAWRF